MIRGLHHIAILCSEREKALAFYCDALGFAVERTHPRPERQDEIIVLQGYGFALELFVSQSNPPRVSGPEAYGLRHLALLVDDVEQMTKKLSDMGFAPEPVRRDSFTGEKMTFVKDPDGLPIELHE